MASTSETGHAVNLNNFNTLTARIIGYGIRYNPTNPLITVAALQAGYTAGALALQHIVQYKPGWDNAINTRQQLFKDMEKFTTRIINAFDATQAVTDAQVKDARTIVRKIRGARKSKKITNPSPTDPVQISTSQQSYANQVLHFGQLVGLVTAEPTYAPNEPELTSPALVIYLNSLATANQTVATSQQPYLDAITERDNTFYKEKTGLLDLAYEAKKYTRSVSTITQNEYNQISTIRFSRPRKK